VAALEDYAILGDRRTAALVSRAGSVDWWCVPRFDAPACFAALVGTPEHGRFSIAPTDGGARTSRRYRPDTMVLETEHETTSGRVRVVDCLALGHSRPLLVRVVEGLDGQVDMAAELVVRFDYGSIVPWVHHVHDRWRAIGGPDGVIDERALPQFVKRQRRIHAARTIKVAVHQTVEDMADVEPAGPASSSATAADQRA